MSGSWISSNTQSGLLSSTNTSPSLAVEAEKTSVKHAVLVEICSVGPPAIFQQQLLVSGGEVIEARGKEIKYLRDKKVYDKMPRRTAKAKGWSRLSRDRG